MPSYRVSTIATLLSVSDDSVRRWLEEDLIEASSDQKGPLQIDGASVVKFLESRAGQELKNMGRTDQTIRNYLPGLITKIIKDKVMSQVEMQCGPFRITSLVSTSSVEELGLEVGSMTSALVKATNVAIQSIAGDKL